jgi:hypothetical protein
MANQHIFHVEELVVPDPSIWPTDLNQTVVRYALLDERNWWWVNGHPFGVLRSMRYDRSSSDARHYLRETSFDALKDSQQWYTWEMGNDGRYHQVIYGR